MEIFKASSSHPVWPDWAIYWTLGNFLKHLATVNLPKFPTLLSISCKGVKIHHFSSVINFGQLLQTFGDFFLLTLPSPDILLKIGHSRPLLRLFRFFQNIWLIPIPSASPFRLHEFCAGSAFKLWIISDLLHSAKLLCLPGFFYSKSPARLGYITLFYVTDVKVL